MRHYIDKIVRQKFAYEQVVDYVMSSIASQKWFPGMKLPPARVLAEELGTSLFTIQTALEHLCREGVIVRKRKLGTFVQGGESRLSCVGVYFSGDFWENSELGFQQKLYRDLQQKWKARGVEVKAFIDDRAESEQETPFLPLLRALSRREIQAVVVAMAHDSNFEWINKIKDPVAQSTFLDMDNRFEFNWRQMIAVSLRSLRDDGCRSVGVISVHSTEGGKTDKLQGGKVFYDEFESQARRLGLEVHDEWICKPDKNFPQPSCKYEYGYRQFHALWRQKKRPDGLLVYSDMVVPGALAAILEKRVRVPDDLKLVLHLNDQLPYFCPVEAKQVVSRIGEAGDALIKLIDAQFKKQPAEPIPLSFHVQTVNANQKAEQLVGV